MAHRDPCLAAVERGLGVYLEKPVARTNEDARAIAEAVRASGAVVAVGYQYRAIDFLPDLRAAVEDDPLGLLTSYSVGATAGRPWFVTPGRGRRAGARASQPPHRPPVRDRRPGGVGAGRRHAGRPGRGRPAGRTPTSTTCSTLSLGFRSGAIGSVLVAWTSPELPSTYTLDVVSARSSVHVELDPGFTARGTARGADVALGLTMPPIRRGMERFLEAVRAGDPGLVACGVDAAAESLDVALACERALADGGRVAVAG